MSEKLNKIKSTFTIKDLENLSGVKMHTIRIWEQRYGLLSPIRSDSNIRTYSTGDMKRLLNVVHLYKVGYKISRIAQLSESEISREIKANTIVVATEMLYLNRLEMASLELNEKAFVAVLKELEEKFSFTELFEKVLFPFLKKVGALWQDGRFKAINEHFVSNIIKQKLFSEIERLPFPMGNGTHEFVLFLPPNELHELSLLYMHYLLRNKGHNSVYLGQSVPLEDLVLFSEKKSKITFIAYSTLYPEQDKFNRYIKDLQDLAMGGNDILFVAGRELDLSDINKSKIQIFKTKEQLFTYIQKMEKKA